MDVTAARKINEAPRQVLESGKGARQDVRVTIAGKTVVYDLMVDPLYDAAGAVVGITGAMLDVTGQQGRGRKDTGANGALPSEDVGDNP